MGSRVVNGRSSFFMPYTDSRGEDAMRSDRGKYSGGERGNVSVHLFLLHPPAVGYRELIRTSLFVRIRVPTVISIRPPAMNIHRE